MALGTIEIMALIAVLAAAIKMIVILVKPKVWADVVKKIWVNPILIGIVSLALAVIVLYYLLQEGITIVQIFAVMLFIALLAASSIAIYSKELTSIMNKFLKPGLLKKAWIPILIWAVLIIWALKELFAA